MGDLGSLTGHQTCVPCIGRQILNQWTTREVPVKHLLNFTYFFSICSSTQCWLLIPVRSPQGTKAAFTGKGSDLQAGPLRAWKSGKSSAGSRAPCGAHRPVLPSLPGWTGPRGHVVQPPLTDRSLGLWRRRDLPKYKVCGPRSPSQRTNFFPYFNPFHIQHSPQPLPHPYPGYNCSSQEQPAARQFQEERLLLSKPVIKRAFPKRPSCPKPEKKDSLMPDGVWVAVSPFLAPGFQSRVQVHLAV